jgi:hypothetical protein
MSTDMDNMIIRLNTNDADIISTDKKDFTFFLPKPIILNEEYYMEVAECLINAYKAPVGVARIGPLLEDMIIVSGTNSNWGNTSLGVYNYYDQTSFRTLTFEVYMNGAVKEAKLLAVTINYLFNTNGVFEIYTNGLSPFYALSGPNSTLTHTALGSSFVWNKSDLFATNHTNLRLLVPLSIGRRYKVSLELIQHNLGNYKNSNKIFSPVIAEIQHTNIDDINKKNNAVLTLVPQLISCIKLNIQDSDGDGLIRTDPNSNIIDNAMFAFKLKKKNKNLTYILE